MSFLQIADNGAKFGVEGVRLDSIDRTILSEPSIVAALIPRADNASREIGGATSSTRRVRVRDSVAPGVVWRSRGGSSSSEGNGTTFDHSTLPGSRVIAVASGARGYISTYTANSADTEIDATGALAGLSIRPAATGGVSMMGLIRYSTDAFSRVASLNDGTRFINVGPRGLSGNKWYATAGAASSPATSTFLNLNTQASINAWHLWWVSVDYATGLLRAGVDTVNIASSRAGSRSYTVSTDFPVNVTAANIGWVQGIAGSTPLWIGPTLVFDRAIGTDTRILNTVGTALAARANITLG